LEGDFDGLSLGTGQISALLSHWFRVGSIHN
jgi:hypothetical protein